MELLETTIRLVAASLCGAVLGWERESQNKPAGLRTNMLVAIGAATATIAALELSLSFQNGPESASLADPNRVISGIIGGLGFLGAGAIIKGSGDVKGLTTAATIWVVGGIGVACGLGYYMLAIASMAISFITLYALGVFERSKAAPASLRKTDDQSHDTFGSEKGGSPTTF